MILSQKEILKAIQKGRICIDPFAKKNIGPASLDLTLGERFWFYKKQQRIILDEDLDYRKLTEEHKMKELILQPGAFVLGITKEKITLPEDICGFLTGRSRFARMGLTVHATASLLQPGIKNHQIFEITNISKNTLVIPSGTKIGQLIFIKMKGKGKYHGIFENQ